MDHSARLCLDYIAGVELKVESRIRITVFDGV